MNITIVLQRYPEAALGSRKGKCKETAGETHSCVSEVCVSPGGSAGKDCSGAKTDGMQDWSTTQVFRFRNFNSSSTYHLWPNAVAIWMSEHWCLYLKSRRIILQRISSNPWNQENVTSVTKNRRAKTMCCFPCVLSIPQTLNIFQRCIKWCSYYSLLLPLKDSVCVYGMLCPVLVGTLPHWPFSLLIAVCWYIEGNGRNTLTETLHDCILLFLSSGKLSL